MLLISSSSSLWPVGFTDRVDVGVAGSARTGKVVVVAAVVTVLLGIETETETGTGTGTGMVGKSDDENEWGEATTGAVECEEMSFVGCFETVHTGAGAFVGFTDVEFHSFGAAD
jgi:hypothetical protein